MTPLQRQKTLDPVRRLHALVVTLSLAALLSTFIGRATGKPSLAAHEERTQSWERLDARTRGLRQDPFSRSGQAGLHALPWDLEVFELDGGIARLEGYGVELEGGIDSLWFVESVEMATDSHELRSKVWYVDSTDLSSFASLFPEALHDRLVFSIRWESVEGAEAPRPELFVGLTSRAPDELDPLGGQELLTQLRNSQFVSANSRDGDRLVFTVSSSWIREAEMPLRHVDPWWAEVERDLAVLDEQLDSESAARLLDAGRWPALRPKRPLSARLPVLLAQLVPLALLALFFRWGCSRESLRSLTPEELRRVGLVAPRSGFALGVIGTVAVLPTIASSVGAWPLAPIVGGDTALFPALMSLLLGIAILRFVVEDEVAAERAARQLLENR